MATPFLLVETPRGGPFGHRFIVPPETNLKSSEIEAYFHRSALGGGPDFIAVKHQVVQHLPNGATREGAETLLLAGLDSKNISGDQEKQLRQRLVELLPELEKLISKDINWTESGQPTLIIRKELDDWLRRYLAAPLGRQVQTRNNSSSLISLISPKDERSALLIGTITALAVGAISLFIWFF